MHGWAPPRLARARTLAPGRARRPPPGPRGSFVQVRIAADQPWDVKADVLVVPLLGQPAFTGPLGELDSRSGKELSALLDFGELRGKRFKAILAGAGADAKLGTKRILLVNAGPPADLNRESVVKLAASAI